MHPYAIDFEEEDSGYTVTIKPVWANSGEEAIEKAKKVFYYEQNWRCVGLDRIKE